MAALRAEAKQREKETRELAGLERRRLAALRAETEQREKETRGRAELERRRLAALRAEKEQREAEMWAAAIAAKPHLFSFHGRIGRAKYLMGYLILFCMTVCCFFLMSVIDHVPYIFVNSWVLSITFSLKNEHNYTPGGAASLVFLASFILVSFWSFAVDVKRFHDLGMSGWWTVLLLIPLIGTLGWFLLSILPGKKGPNKHGPGRRRPRVDVFA